MTEAKLTGRIRYRTERRLFRGERLILQVEERGLVDEYIGGRVDRRWVSRWRDAKTSDLTEKVAP